MFKQNKPFFKSIQLILTLIIVVLLLSMILTQIELRPSSVDSVFTPTTIRSGSRASYDFTFEFSTPSATIEPNSEGVVDLWINNKGDNDDSYGLTLHELPSGWTAIFYTLEGKLPDNPTVDVNSNTNKLIQTYVKAPASGEITLTVTCKSTSTNDEITAEVLLEAKYVVRVLLNGTSNVRTVFAGESASFQLEVKNYQDASDVVELSIKNRNVKIQDNPDDFDWCVWFDNRTITVPAEESKDVLLKVYAPVQGKPKDSITLIVIASPASTTQVFESRDLIANIPEIYNITYNVTLNPDSPLTLPNSTVNYTLKLKNAGNVKDTISLQEHRNDNAWEIYFFLDEVFFNPLTGTLELDVDEEKEFQVQVSIPLGAKADEEHIIIYGIYSNKKGGSTSINEIIIATKVLPISDIEIVLIEGGSTIDLQKVSYYEFEVHNKGNGKDELSLLIPAVSIPTGWQISFSSVKNTQNPNNTKNVDFSNAFALDNLEPLEYLPVIPGNYQNIILVLETDQKVYVNLAITPPATGKHGTETFKIYGESESGNIDTDTKIVYLTLRASDLSLSGLQLNPEEPTPDEKVKITLTVKNDYHLPAENFYVKLIEINGDIVSNIDSKKISSLNPNQTEEVSFSWTAKEVRELGYILKVELSGDIIPKDNNTPFRTQYVFVKEKPSESKTTNNAVILITGIIIIILILFLFLWLFSQRKRGAEALESFEEHPAERKAGTKISTKEVDKSARRERAKGSKGKSSQGKIKKV